jgi:hypothetical protein
VASYFDPVHYLWQVILILPITHGKQNIFLTAGIMRIDGKT